MLEYASLIKPGDRSVQEDAILCMVGAGVDGGTGSTVGVGSGSRLGAESALFALADGLGGHGYGEAASAIAVQSASDAYLSDPEDLDACFLLGQERIIAEQQATGILSGMKTTLVVLCLHQGVARWGHIGDSRLYWFKRGKLVGRTLDHSVPQMLAATGEIREKDIRHHPDRNRLLRSMGVEWNSPRHQLGQELALVGDESFLLTSDGFWEWVDERQMAVALRRAKSPDEWLQRLDVLAAAEADKAVGAKRDNYSAIAVWVRA